MSILQAHEQGHGKAGSEPSGSELSMSTSPPVSGSSPLRSESTEASHNPLPLPASSTPGPWNPTIPTHPKAEEERQDNDKEGLPPMLTITESFPLSASLVLEREVAKGVEKMKGKAEKEETSTIKANTPTLPQTIPLPTSTSTSPLPTPTTTLTPTATKTITAPPQPTPTQTPASSPRKRSWFYSSSSASPSKSSLLASTPTAAPSAIHTPAPAPTNALMTTEGAQSTSSPQANASGPGIGTTATRSIKIPKPDLTQVEELVASPLEDAVVSPPPAPAVPVAVGAEGKAEGEEGKERATLQWEGVTSTALVPAPPSGTSGGGEGLAPSVTGAGEVTGKVGETKVEAKEVTGSDVKKAEDKEEKKEERGSGGMFGFGYALLGRRGTAPVPVVPVADSSKETAPQAKKEEGDAEVKAASPSTGEVKKEGVAQEGGSPGDSKNEANVIAASAPDVPRAAAGKSIAATTGAPGATGTTSTDDARHARLKTSHAASAISGEEGREPVRCGEGGAAGEGVLSAEVDEARPERGEGVKAQKDGDANRHGQDLQPGSSSSTANAATTTEQQDAYYSWWSYVGWGSTTSVNEASGASNGAAARLVADGDGVGPMGAVDSAEAAALDSATAVGSGPGKEARVGSTVSGETEREKVQVTLSSPATTLTLATISPSEVVAEAKVKANGNEGAASNGRGFAAGTSEDVLEEGGGAGVGQGNGRGKKGDGELDVVGVSDDVGQGAMVRGEENKLEGADALALGSGSEAATGGGDSGGGMEDARSGPSWLSPWAWMGSTSTSNATTTSSSGAVANPELVSASEASGEGGEGPDGVAAAQGGRAEEETKEQKVDSVALNPDEASAEAKVDEAPELTVPAPERALELPNPIEESLKANTTGWASFFSKQSLFVKAIGYGEANVPPKPIKRDEHGVEIMDLDSDDENDSDHGSKKEDESSNGGESRSRSLVPKLLTYPVEKLATASSSRNASPTAAGRSSAAKDGGPPAEPLTGDEDIKRKVSSVPVGKKPSKGSSNGPSTPVPPSPSGSVPTPSSKPPQPPIAEKSKSAPVTPKRTASPSPSVTKKNSTSSSLPNLVLPTWADTFYTPPRSIVLRPPSPPVSPPTTPGSAQDAGVGTRLLGKTMKFVSNVLWAKDGGQHGNGHDEQHQAGPSTAGSARDRKGRRHFNAPHPLRRSSSGGSYDIASLLEQERKVRFERYGQELPKSWEVLDGALEAGNGGKWAPSNRLASSLSSSGHELLGHVSAEDVARGNPKDVLRGCRRVVIIGVHGWFPGAVMRTVLGEPTGTSSKFANMMEQAVQEFENEQGVQLEKVTKIPLEGEGTIERRVEKLYSSLIANGEWMDDLREADVIFVATHSQGSVVSTHLMSKLVEEGVIYTRPDELVPSGGDTFPSAVGLPRSSERKVQRVCCLALCGIHLGPLRYLRSSSVVAPYIQYFENAAARELFEFQNTESAVSKAYVKALGNVLDHGIKMVYVASLNDQVVPIYSGIFTAATHPLLLRALYIDGDAYHSSDFLSNLLVLLLKLRNSGIPDGGLLAHLSEATAGSLSGVGHSTAYEELATYSLAVRYLFMTNMGSEKHTPLVIEPFDAAHEQNDYEIPWSLRDVIADERVIHFFSNEVSKLRDAFRDWHPKTTILRDLKRKLQPIQRLPPSFSTGSYSTSKL